MPRIHTLLIVPANDPEAALIIEIARALNLDLWVSEQPHGARLEKEEGLWKAIKEGAYERVVIVEMPGVAFEKQIENAGIELVIIDHHDYTDLKRAHDAKGTYLPSSLEQFLKHFRLTDSKLQDLGFDPVLVRGIGIWDRGFYWALQDEGYKKKDIHRVMDYRDALMKPYKDPAQDAKKQRAAEQAWKARKTWKEFVLIESKSDLSIRGRLSLIIAREIGKPTPMILVEQGRGFIYVQETDYAEELFAKFGGFTFGTGRNWGYKNAGAKKKVRLKDVKRLLSSLL